MTVKRKLSISLLLFTLLLVSCGGQATAEPTADVNATITAGVATFAASIYQTQTALVPPATNTPLPTWTPAPTNTAILLPTIFASPTTQVIYFYPSVTPTINLTRTATGTLPTATVDPAKLAYGCNNMLLIAEMDVPAGTVFQPGEKFSKTWKVANTGTCEWLYLYRPVLSGGEVMDGSASAVGRKVAPGEWQRITVSFTAPKKPGTYVGYWRMGDQSGHAFGSTLTVSIVVGAPTKTPKPTAIVTTAVPTTEIPPTTAVPTTETPSATPITPTAP